MTKKVKNNKIQTTLPKDVFDEIKQIGLEFGYTDSELLRVLIQRGLDDFKHMRNVRLSLKAPKESGAISKVSAQIGDDININNISKSFRNGWS
ncbi:MAG: hypothetical protein ACTSW1_08655 [Candidatus Hodarchaeales archaeon]